MAIVDIGRICVKLKGRDAGKACIITEKIDDNFVMIDGYVRRRRCNIKHLLLVPKTVKIKVKASHDECVKALESIGLKRKEPKYTRKPRSDKNVVQEKVKKPKRKLLKKKAEKPKKAKK